jgi:predicted nucleic acid-binding Zn ribbon protein
MADNQQDKERVDPYLERQKRLKVAATVVWLTVVVLVVVLIFALMPY